MHLFLELRKEFTHFSLESYLYSYGAEVGNESGC